MSGIWLREQLDAARREINEWPEWKKEQLVKETEQIPTKPEKPNQSSRKEK